MSSQVERRSRSAGSPGLGEEADGSELVIGIVAHELAGSLHGITGALTRLSEREVLTPIDRRLLRLAADDARRLASTSEALLGWAKGTRGLSGEWISAAQLLRSIVGSMPAEHGDRVRLQVAGDARIEVDPLLMRCAIENLLRNAIHHGEGGRVVLRLDPAGERGVWITVSDDGPGIPAVERSRVFGPYVRGATAGGVGAGLGLHITRSIVEAHGGSLRIVPVQQGTEIRIEIEGEWTS
jgi:two-component system sensor histidine kinase KdpD